MSSHRIALDLDGTLEDSRRDMIAAVHRVRAGFSLPVRDEVMIAPWVNQGMDTLYKHCFNDYLADGAAAGRLEAVRQAYEADYAAHVAVDTKLYDGIAPALAALRELGRLADVTNKPERISVRLLDALGVGPLIDAVIGGDTCADIKPNPVMLRTAAQRIGLDARGRAVMIGDTAADIKMGRAFGAKTIWCAWGYAAQPGETPDFTARAPGELPDLVRNALK